LKFCTRYPIQLIDEPLINKALELGKLEKVRITKVWPKEDQDFTPWLANEANIALLGEELNMDLEVQGTEVWVGKYKADIVCKETGSDGNVIIENQFGKTDPKHLGQIMTYASGLKASTVIWIAEKFEAEHRSALDWLNSVTDDTVEFFGIEIELFRIGNSIPAPMFNIISSPNEWNKSVKRKAEAASLTPTKALQLEYWQTLKETLEGMQGIKFKPQKPLPQHWTNISIGKYGYKICALANSRDYWIGVQLVVYTTDALTDFKRLRDKYEADSLINLSNNLEWAEKDGGKEHHVNLIFHNFNPLEKGLWREQHQILIDWVKKFHSYFGDKIREL